MKKTLKWFTLIEMLIVIVIIGILAAVLIPKIGWARERAEDVAVKANVRTISTYLMWKSMDNALPEALDWTNTEMPNVATEDRGDYTYAKDGHKFIVCGDLQWEDWNWNTGADAANVESTLLSTWGYYCMQG